MDPAFRAERAPDRRYPDFRAFLEAARARGGNRPAFRWRPEGEAAERVLSFEELGASADALGARLLAEGLARGSSVALLSENRPEWCAAYLGVVAAGLVVVPLDASLDGDGLLRTLAAASCRALVASGRMLGRHPELLGAPGLVLAVDFDASIELSSPDPDGPPPVLSWERLVGDGAGPGAGLLPAAGEIGPGARAVLFFTSGTTGVAKGITLSHGAVIANVDAARAALVVDERDVFVALLPLHHTYATTCSFLSAVEAGSTCVVVDRVAPSAVVRAVREGGVTMMIGVPLLFDKLRAGIEAEMGRLPPLPRAALRALLVLSRVATLRLGLPLGRPLFAFLRKRAGLGTVRLAVSGGGPLAPATADFFDAIGVELVQGYGMSENGPLISVNLPGRKDNRTVGLPVRRTELRIDDPDASGVGEIQVRSPSLMEGYLDAPEATAAAFTPDGWLRTGDLGRIDRRGFLAITGRRKSLIVTEGGKNVYPEEIEARFEDSPWIQEVLVMGRRRRAEAAGEEILAVCVPDRERLREVHGERAEDVAFVRSLLRDEVGRVNRGLPPYMKVADFVVRDEEFEKTGTRKIRRFLYAEYAGLPPAR